jgi:hypothetical protein
VRHPAGHRPHRTELSGVHRGVRPWGFQIKCGTGYDTDLTQAAAAAGQHNYVDQCETALLTRRLWTIPLVAISGLVVRVVTVASAIASARETLVPHRDTA